MSWQKQTMCVCVWGNKVFTNVTADKRVLFVDDTPRCYANDDEAIFVAHARKILTQHVADVLDNARVRRCGYHPNVRGIGHFLKAFLYGLFELGL